MLLLVAMWDIIDSKNFSNEKEFLEFVFHSLQNNPQWKKNYGKVKKNSIEPLVHGWIQQLKQESVAELKKKGGPSKQFVHTAELFITDYQFLVLQAQNKLLASAKKKKEDATKKLYLESADNVMIGAGDNAGMLPSPSSSSGAGDGGSKASRTTTAQMKMQASSDIIRQASEHKLAIEKTAQLETSLAMKTVEAKGVLEQQNSKQNHELAMMKLKLQMSAQNNAHALTLASNESASTRVEIEKIKAEQALISATQQREVIAMALQHNKQSKE